MQENTLTIAYGWSFKHTPTHKHQGKHTRNSHRTLVVDTLDPLHTSKTKIQEAQWSPLEQAGTLNDWQRLNLSPQWPSQTWWHLLEDSTLSQLVKDALAQHPTLAQLQAQLEQAQAQVKVVNALRLPQVSLGASYLWQQYGKNQFVFPLQGRTFHSFQLPINVSYELDLWGKNKLQRDASKQEMLATTFDLDNARLQLSSAVVTSYLQYRKLQGLLTLQSQTEALTRKQYERLEARHAQGLIADEEGLRQAHAQWLQAQAETAVYRQSLAVTQHQLAYLTGHDTSQWQVPEPPETPNTAWFDARVKKLSDTPLQVGIPSELAWHRPDIQAQEALLEAAGIRVKVARKMFLPSFNIGGSSGLNAIGIQNLFKASSLNSFLNPTISQPLFTGGVLTGQLTIAKKQYEALFQAYKDTVLKAYVEVENSFSDLHSHYEVLHLVQARQEDTRQTEAQLARKAAQGLSTHVEVIPAQLAHLELEKAVLTQASQCLVSWISLQKTLGGDTSLERVMPSDSPRKEKADLKK
ncbi:MAG: efflux transporter outer membrane subunit [Vampirovibrionales bacterium]